MRSIILSFSIASAVALGCTVAMAQRIGVGGVGVGVGGPGGGVNVGVGANVAGPRANFDGRNAGRGYVGDGDRWRYRWDGGRWWYWLPTNRWTYYNDGNWVDYATNYGGADSNYRWYNGYWWYWTPTGWLQWINGQWVVPTTGGYTYSDYDNTYYYSGYPYNSYYDGGYPYYNGSRYPYGNWFGYYGGYPYRYWDGNRRWDNDSGRWGTTWNEGARAGANVQTAPRVENRSAARGDGSASMGNRGGGRRR
jgi:hypothetical protein